MFKKKAKSNFFWVDLHPMLAIDDNPINSLKLYLSHIKCSINLENVIKKQLNAKYFFEVKIGHCYKK